MARRKKEEVIEEINVITEEIEKPAEKPEIKATVKKATKKKATVKITAPRVNVRKSPSLMAEVLKIAVADDKFDLVNDGEDGFYEVAYDGTSAFIMKEYAELS